MAYVNIPGPDLASGTGTLPVASEPAPSPIWTKYTVSHTAFQTAALTNAVTLFTLPAKGVILKVIIKHSTAFAGTTTYTLSVGVAGTAVKYIAAFDVKQAVADGTYSVAATTVNVGVESFASGTAIIATATSTVQNLSSSSAGAADIWVLTATLP
jgi:hypothetical protein